MLPDIALTSLPGSNWVLWQMELTLNICPDCFRLCGLGQLTRVPEYQFHNKLKQLHKQRSKDIYPIIYVGNDKECLACQSFNGSRSAGLMLTGMDVLVNSLEAEIGEWVNALPSMHPRPWRALYF